MSDDTNGEQQGQPSGGGAAYTPPATQADLDKIIESRLTRERSKFQDYDTFKEKAGKFDAAEPELTELRTKVAGFEQRDQIAEWSTEITKDSAVPASALRGNTREELEKHHTQLSALLPKATRRTTPPGKSSGEDAGPKRAAAALRQLRQG